MTPDGGVVFEHPRQVNIGVDETERPGRPIPSDKCHDDPSKDHARAVYARQNAHNDKRLRLTQELARAGMLRSGKTIPQYGENYYDADIPL